MVSQYKGRIATLVQDQQQKVKQIEDDDQHFEHKIDHDQNLLHSQKQRYESTLAQVKHEIEVKVDKLLKELAHEKALLAQEKHHEAATHVKDEKEFHREEHEIKHHDNIVLSTEESKAAKNLSKAYKALKH